MRGSVVLIMTAVALGIAGTAVPFVGYVSHGASVRPLIVTGVVAHSPA